MEFIYALRDPRVHPVLWRYVGKAIHPESRLSGHLVECYLLDSYCQRWLRSLLRDDVKPELTILQQIPDDYPETWQEAERKWIMLFRLMGYPLTNLTDGGDGISGWRHTEEALQKMRERRRARDPEISRKAGRIISRVKKGVPLTLAQRQGISRGLMGHEVSLEARRKTGDKNRIALKGNRNAAGKRTGQALLNMREGQLRRRPRQDPVLTSRNRSEGQKKRWRRVRECRGSATL